MILHIFLLHNGLHKHGDFPKNTYTGDFNLACWNSVTKVTHFGNFSFSLINVLKDVCNVFKQYNSVKDYENYIKSNVHLDYMAIHGFL